MRVLAVDPGTKRIGLAISDPTGTIANPLGVLVHISRGKNAARIAAAAVEQDAGLIVVGLALNAEGEDTEASRSARNLAAEIGAQTEIPVALWDEGGSTRAAWVSSARSAAGTSTISLQP